MSAFHAPFYFFSRALLDLQLKFRAIETVMTHIQDAPNGIASRPSNLIDSAAHVTHFFARYPAFVPTSTG